MGQFSFLSPPPSPSLASFSAQIPISGAVSFMYLQFLDKYVFGKLQNSGRKFLPKRFGTCFQMHESATAFFISM
jgi:hypothetical protein